MRIRCANPVLLIYLVWVYFLPAVLNWWVGYESEIYVNPSNGPWTWLYGGVLCLVTAAFAFRVNFSDRPWSEPALVTWKVPVGAISTVLVGILAISIFGISSGLSRWRYAEEGLSGSLGPMELMFVLAPNVLELVLFALLFFKYQQAPRTTRSLLLLVALCMALTASGIGPMLAVLLALIAALAPGTVRRLILRGGGDQVTVKRRTPLARRLLLLSPLIAGLGFLSYLVGDAIKSDISIWEALDALGQDGLDIFLNYLVGRLSVQWYSLVAALHQYVDLGQGDPLQNLLAPITNAGFRLSSLLGGLFGIERPLDGSLARINYGLINIYPFNDREGTTPGLIGSFVLAFPIWLGPFALMAYLWLYDRIQEGLRRRMAGRPTWFGEVLLLYFTVVFFASPLDFLLVFDPMLLTVGAWCYMAYQAHQKGAAHGSIYQRA